MSEQVVVVREGDDEVAGAGFVRENVCALKVPAFAARIPKRAADWDEGAEDEDGEWLMRIETRNGQKKKVWTMVPGKGKGKGKGKGVECYRCGRPNHVRAECRAKTHVNGGEPKEFKNKT